MKDGDVDFSHQPFFEYVRSSMSLYIESCFFVYRILLGEIGHTVVHVVGAGILRTSHELTVFACN